ncbi:hypothetical protein K461DRAFT_111253 [Myriangium duriaei CBS 260.36]|uniref:PCI domain-containing protein n=1 Tax=Myriangium duriaei CBS 260.36 TaxID=1168546 RepID=A0A9P4J585_9PEZI|nr:hypothetical protein K461DRAFT_111253 [Myriangium duriaei CBS 260.36]
MEKIIIPFRRAFEREEGYALAEVLSPLPPSDDPERFYAIQRSANSFTIQSDLRSAFKSVRLDPQEREIWVDVFVHYWKSINDILAAEAATALDSNPPDWTQVYTSWKELLNFIHRGYTQSHFPPWTIPILYTVTKHLRTFAIRADATILPSTSASPGVNSLDEPSTDSTTSHPNLEDCARQINRIFALVTQDRSPPPNRKYGTYYIALLLFRTYFRLSSISLCKNIIRSINAASAADMPALELFPKAHQVGYRYYVGVVAFLDERYEDALRELEAAYGACLAGPGGARQAERILGYLVPTQLLVRHRLPRQGLLEQYPALEGLYKPLCTAVRKGDLGAFDAALAAGEDQFVRRRVYLTLERGRDVCLRNLFRRVYLAGGWDEKVGETGDRVRRSRFPVAEFAAGMRIMGLQAEGDEVEALVAGLIYKGLIKGYISRQHGMVVLNKKGGAFPGTGV